MHYKKLHGKTDVRRVLEHSDRGQDGVAAHEHSNEDIDSSRTHLNYELHDRGGLSAAEYHSRRIAEIDAETKQRTGAKLRKDAVILCSWAITAPEDLPQEKQEQFFREVYEWFAERYGKDNVVTAAVHLDETSPHMHFQWIPMTADGRLCAKNLETPKSLKTVHPDLEQHLTEVLGCKVTLLNGQTVKGNKTITQLKTERLQSQAQELTAQLDELRTARSEEVFERAGAIKAIAEKVSGGKKLTPAEVETVQNVAAAIAQMQAEFRRQSDAAVQKQRIAREALQELQTLREAMQDTAKQQAEQLKLAQDRAEQAVRIASGYEELFDYASPWLSGIGEFRVTADNLSAKLHKIQGNQAENQENKGKSAPRASRGGRNIKEERDL